jgi:ketosteroid isomerase-like protein
MATHVSQPAELFVAAINAHDVEQLLALMTPDHLFVDSLGNVLSGHGQMPGAWHGYVAMVPDYHLTIERVFSDAQEVLLCGVAGRTFSTDGPRRPENAWSTPVALRARIRDGLVAEWRVYADNEPLRERMRVSPV